jgi:hypothetical protein
MQFIAESKWLTVQPDQQQQVADRATGSAAASVWAVAVE